MRLCLVNQRGDGFGTDERRVAVQHHRGALEAANGVAHDAHRVASAQSLGLLDKLDVVIAIEDGADLVRMASHHHDDAVGTSFASGVHGPPHKRPTKKFVSNFGMTGLHARTLASSKDDRVE